MQLRGKESYLAVFSFAFVSSMLMVWMVFKEDLKTTTVREMPKLSFKEKLLNIKYNLLNTPMDDYWLKKRTGNQNDCTLGKHI